jgi:hypothetical protein
MKKKVLRSKSAGGTSLEYRLFVTSVCYLVRNGGAIAQVSHEL